MIELKTAAEISIMQENGKLLAQILFALCEQVQPGRTTQFFDDMAVLRRSMRRSTKRSYTGFPLQSEGSKREMCSRSILG